MKEESDTSTESVPSNNGVAPLKIFINYRKSDTGIAAAALYQALEPRFGKENVFLDVVTLEPGTRWLDEIKKHGTRAGAFLVMIGPRWAEIMSQRSRRRHVEPTEDFVRVEIELALRRNSPVRVIPILVDDAVMPPPLEIPQSLRPLLDLQAIMHLRGDKLKEDLDAIADHLELVAADLAREQAAPPVPKPEGDSRPQPPPAPRRPAPVGGPDELHYEEVAKLLGEEGALVTFLGPGVNTSDRVEAVEGKAQALPDSEELATYLAEKFDFPSEPADLAQVAQYVVLQRGPSDLYRMLKQILGADLPPSPVHRFLADLPGKLRELELSKPHQLIVTTNYDDALERAFVEAGEKYDLAVYMASGDHKGKFVHIPFGQEPLSPVPILVPQKYVDFPIDDMLELERTVIVKIHGAVDRAPGMSPWQENYVITENDFIDYLSEEPIGSILPTQILNKLRYSHFLFLGYTMRDWNLRVFVHRVWGSQLPGTSWAIQEEPDQLEKQFWKDLRVDLFGVPLMDYLEQLVAHLALLARRPAQL